MHGLFGTAGYYAKVRRLLAGQISGSTSIIRIHIPHRRFDRGGFLQYFDANHTRWVVSGAPPVWHVSSVIAGKQQKNFSLGQKYPEELDDLEYSAAAEIAHCFHFWRDLAAKATSTATAMATAQRRCDRAMMPRHSSPAQASPPLTTTALETHHHD